MPVTTCHGDTTWHFRDTSPSRSWIHDDRMPVTTCHASTLALSIFKDEIQHGILETRHRHGPDKSPHWQRKRCRKMRSAPWADQQRSQHHACSFKLIQVNPKSVNALWFIQVNPRQEIRTCTLACFSSLHVCNTKKKMCVVKSRYNFVNCHQT